MRRTIPTESGQYDIRGIPICDGDLIRCRHYRHRRRRQQMWSYFIVGQKEGRFVLYNWADFERKMHQCLLMAITECEIVAESGLHGDSSGNIMTFNERPRRRVG